MTALPEPVQPEERHADLVAPRRVSNAERESVAKRLRDATSEGYLDLSELDERLSAVYAARTEAELVPLTRDLPVAGVAPRPGGQPAPSRGAFAFMGGFNRKGRWSVPKRFSCLAVFAGGVVDLREARFVDGDSTIRVYAIFGGVEVITSPDIDAHVTGVGILGAFDDETSDAPAGRGPTVVVSGLALFGGVSVKHRPAIRD
jgi:hypothetical protein